MAATIAQRAPFPVHVQAGKTTSGAVRQQQEQPFCDGSHKGGPYTPIKYTATEAATVYFCGCKQTGISRSATARTRRCSPAPRRRTGQT